MTAGHGVPLSHRSHDWAIIDAPHVSLCPFGLPSRGPHAAAQQTSPVMFHGGSGGTQAGIWSKRPTFVMSGVDGSVVENYTLTPGPVRYVFTFTFRGLNIANQRSSY